MLFDLVRRPSSGSYEINHFLSKITESLQNKSQIIVAEVLVVARGMFLNRVLTKKFRFFKTKLIF